VIFVVNDSEMNDAEPRSGIRFIVLILMDPETSMIWNIGGGLDRMSNKTKLLSILAGAVSTVIFMFCVKFFRVDLDPLAPLISWAFGLFFALNGLSASNRGWIKVKRLSYGLGLFSCAYGIRLDDAVDRDRRTE